MLVRVQSRAPFIRVKSRYLGLFLVHAIHKFDNFGIDADVGETERTFEVEFSKGTTARECYVGLTSSKGATTAEINANAVVSLALGFMNSDSIGELQGELDEASSNDTF